MNLNGLETKCPVCGTKNAPVEFTANMGFRGPTVKVECLCTGFRRRLFRPKKACKVKYRIELIEEDAERVINEICSAGGTGNE